MRASPLVRENRVVLAHGVFDVLHLGHLIYLEEARRQGDELVVSVTSDRYASKGPGRPVFNQDQRAKMLSALSCVDRVIINDQPSAIPLIASLKPHVYVKGPDYANGGGLIAEETAAVEAVGGRMHFTTGDMFSSSALINRHLDVLEPEVREYLERARKANYAQRIPELIDSISNLSVLFIGETIIDEYVYSKPLGKPPKEFVLCGHEQGRETFAGGVQAAANHLRTFCKRVEVLSTKSIRKTRYVDRETTRKLFEVYTGDLADDSPDNTLCLVKEIERQAPEYDVVVVIDFGHGMLTSEARKAIRKHAKFLAVNTQSNAANHGFNRIGKYLGASFICLDVPEGRIEIGDQSMGAESLGQELAMRYCHRVIVTDGRAGSVAISPMGTPVRVPALATKVVDTMGAGDAFLAIAAPLASMSDDMEMVAFIGNIVGAAKVGIVGHRQAVDKETVLRHAGTLLK